MWTASDGIIYDHDGKLLAICTRSSEAARLVELHNQAVA